ncbi:porin [Hyphomicrobium sp.]|uniref:porin n=1 Tax=Hyphomicrobium sp. TaxID=82 RepID=UPI001DD5976A|nr:porin [Hyphomicrobium sp.]MBY0559262.1 porin [Hyphomicrobium sp.]
MKSVFKLSSSRMALVAAFGLAIGFTPAQAADLGGDCCADLEERVAELEATSARKGNRKVSLTITGWVNEAVFAWDDGSERNAYVGTNTLEQSRVKFNGEAQIAPGFSAGYTLEIGAQGNPLNGFNQNSPSSSNSNALTVRKSNWWLKSKDYGKLTVGQEGTALYHLLDDADGVNTRNFSDAQAPAVYQGGFFLRHNGAQVGGGNGVTWGNILAGVDNGTVGQDGRRNIVRYDSPTIAGFVVTASWGEDDLWGVALTYTGQWGDFKVLGKAGYGKNSDENISACSKGLSAQNCELFGTAATIQHVPTGLFVYGGFAQNTDNRIRESDPGADATSTLWYIQGGIEQKWMPIGKTTIFGEYRNDNGGSKLNVNFNGGNLQSTDINFAGAGIIQNIEPAAMDLYVMYRHADGSITNTADTRLSLDAFDMVIMGALLRF